MAIELDDANIVMFRQLNRIIPDLPPTTTRLTLTLAPDHLPKIEVEWLPKPIQVDDNDELIRELKTFTLTEDA